MSAYREEEVAGLDLAGHARLLILEVAGHMHQQQEVVLGVHAGSNHQVVIDLICGSFNERNKSQ